MQCDNVKIVNEIKCTRDIYVHSNGISNHTYERKVGARSRARVGHELPLTDDYLSGSKEKIEEVIKDFHNKGPSNYLEYNRVRAFEEMWNMTRLSTLVKFEDAWEKQPDGFFGEIVVPRDINWVWSGSEEALYQFL